LKKQDKIIGLLKFGKRSHMEELLHDGHLFMSPLSTFINMEDDHLRADQDEAIDYSMPAEGAKLLIKHNDEWLPVGGLTGALRSTGPERVKANVFCLHSILASRCASHPEQLIDSRNSDFGDAFVIFMDADEFLRRVQVETSRRNLNFVNAAVEYVDPNSYVGEMGIFRKFSKFHYQREYRLAILSGTAETYSLHIGSIADIARIGNLSDIDKTLRAQPPHTLLVSDELEHSPTRRVQR
jgi:hypothetical protein